MKKSNKKQPKFIAANEQDLAAKYFTLSNTAMMHCLDRCDNNIHRAYEEANSDVLSETGVSLKEELDSWGLEIKNGSGYCYDEWQKVKGKYNDPVLEERVERIKTAADPQKQLFKEMMDILR